MAANEPALMPPPSDLPRKKSRLNRLSSFFLPSLITSQPTEQPTGHSVHRKPLSANSTLQEKYSVPDWEAHVDSRLNASTADLTLGASLLAEPYKRHTKNPSGGKMTLKKQAPVSSQTPGMPDHPAPPVPPKSPVRSSPTPSHAIAPGLDFQFHETQASPKLTKSQPQIQRQRSNSSHEHISHPSSSRLDPRHASPGPEHRGRSSSAQPRSTRLQPTAGNHNESTTSAGSRPITSNGSQSPSRGEDKRGRLRRSWFPGNRSRSSSQDLRGVHGSVAWTLGSSKADYNTSFLSNGERVPELWNESGQVLVYLHPRGSGKGPSFKVMSFVTDYSLAFNDLIQAELTSPSTSGRSRSRSFVGQDSLSAADAERLPRDPPPLSDRADAANGETKLYLPIPLDELNQPAKGSGSDLERLISVRNMFAFLTGQPLVGTKAQPTLFSVLMRVASLYQEFEFTNVNGSTFGDSVDMSFGFFMEQTAVADVRHSREKTLEALILGERMRSWDLYNEAFAHAVGKYSPIRDLHSPLWEQVSSVTRQRLERAHLDLLNRQNNVNNRLENFEFPALFSGIASSATQYKGVKFGVWRRSFNRMRSFVLGYYKTNFGSWPPKARSKKNPFSESGLNRQVLKILYSDLCALYDLLVDRNSITPRVIDQAAEDVRDETGSESMEALRKILTEFDHSEPPVLPPIPYDIPQVPEFTSVKENFYDLPAKEQARLDKNYQEHEFLLILNKSYDFETLKLKLPFLEQFSDFELKEAKGKSISEIADQRIGYWLFLYVVIQSLPMLVVDAPGLKFTEGVEYFMCQPPKGTPPWMGDGTEIRKRWYEVSGGAGYVELSEDTIEFSVEGIYHRSHCWVAAKNWEQGMNSLALPSDQLSPLQAPQGVFTDMDPGLSLSPKMVDRSESPPTSVSPQLALRAPRGSSPAGRPGYRSSIALGLEPVPLPGGTPISRPGSRVFSAHPGPIGAARPPSAPMNRSRSSGNLQGMAMGPPSAGGGPSATDSRSSSRQELPQTGSTFDDILKDMDNKPKKKKGLFG